MKVIIINNSPYNANAYLVNGTILIDVGMESSDIIPELKKNTALNNIKKIISRQQAAQKLSSL